MILSVDATRTRDTVRSTFFFFFFFLAFSYIYTYLRRSIDEIEIGSAALYTVCVWCIRIYIVLYIGNAMTVRDFCPIESWDISFSSRILRAAGYLCFFFNRRLNTEGGDDWVGTCALFFCCQLTQLGFGGLINLIGAESFIGKCWICRKNI